MDIILSTRNVSKLLQIQGCFVGSPVSILTLNDVGVEGEAVEDGKTLEENAIKKALYAKKHAGGNFWVMADDTGLFIHALNGEPGVDAAVWAGSKEETTTAFALEKLAGITDRRAAFETVVAVVNPNGEVAVFNGKVEGVMLLAARVPSQPNMPYSPLFQPIGSTKTWAEMTLEEENAISHRGIAFKKVRQFLEEATKQAV